MRRLLLNVLTVLSLLLCVAVCVLWVRSLSTADSLAVGGRGGALFWLFSRNSAFEITVVDDWPVAAVPRRWVAVPIGAPLDHIRLSGFVRQTRPWSVLGSVSGYSNEVMIDEVVGDGAVGDEAVGRRVVRHVRPIRTVTGDYWLAVALAGALPAARAFARVRRTVRERQSNRAGCCRSCGYDLRGSQASGRCPECGTPSPSPADQPPAPRHCDDNKYNN